MTLITAMTAESARSFFLKHKSYCSFALPAYFDFAPLLLAVKNALEQKQNGINDIGYKKACDFDNVNYCLLYTSPSPRDGATSRMPSSA